MDFGSTGKSSIAWLRYPASVRWRILSSVFGIVMNPRHDVGPPEPLRVLKRRVRNNVPRLEVEKPKDNRRRSQVQRQAVNRSIGAVDLFAVEKYFFARARNAGIDFQFLALDREMKSMPLDFHFTAAHRVAADDARILLQCEHGRKAENFL